MSKVPPSVGQSRLESLAKRQRSILEFTRARRVPEFIDLTESEEIEIKVEEDFKVKKEDFEVKEEDFEVKEEYDVVVKMECPICNLNITYYAIDDRCRHVDFCITRDASVSVSGRESGTNSTNTYNSAAPYNLTSQSEITIKSDISDNITSTKNIKSTKNITSTTRVTTSNPSAGSSNLIPNSSKLKDSKKRKLSPPNPNIKYINDSSRTTSKEKIIKPPTKITPSRTKRPIPTVKVMTFPVSLKQLYQVSVDAFCYAPHETIDQYFLSHFHSDHYGGISKKWSYERVFKDNTDYNDDSRYKKIIYCTKITGRLLTLRFSIDPRFIKHLELDTRYMIRKYIDDFGAQKPQDFNKNHESELLEGSLSESDQTFNLPDGGIMVNELQPPSIPGLYITTITANHCPGSAIFLFESLSLDGKWHRILHCGDFRVNKQILCHPLLSAFSTESNLLVLNKVYLDTTYMSPLYNFPKQELVCDTVSNLFHELSNEDSTSLFSTWFGALQQSRITDFLTKKPKKKKFLILVGTYLIGKERLAMAILKRLNCLIYNLNINSRDDKMDILRSYEDEYLDLVLTDDELGGENANCTVHLVPMTIVGSISELSNYFNHNNYYQHFERCVGLRPTGWSFQPRYVKMEDKQPEEPTLDTLFSIMNQSPTFSFIDDVLPQVPTPRATNTTRDRPDQSLYRIYSVPYSEHSSFRELAYFVVFFNIGDVVPTVNISSSDSINKMMRIIKSWELARTVKGNPMDVQEVDLSLAQAFSDLSLDKF